MRQQKHDKSIAQVITKRRMGVLIFRDYAALLVRVCFLVGVIWLLLTQVFVISQANGNAMLPAIKDGDLLFGFRLYDEYAKNDVVIYTAEGKRQVGRVIAKGGDVITLDESGSVRVNGTVQDGQIMYPTEAKDALTYPYQVENGCLFIMGDYRTQSRDSRDFGPILSNQVEAKVITVLRRRGI